MSSARSTSSRITPPPFITADLDQAGQGAPGVPWCFPPRQLQVRHALGTYSSDAPFGGRGRSGWTDAFDVAQLLTRIYDDYGAITEDIIRTERLVRRQREDVRVAIDRLIHSLANAASIPLQGVLNAYDQRPHTPYRRPEYVPRPARLFTTEESTRVASPFDFMERYPAIFREPSPAPYQRSSRHRNLMPASAPVGGDE